MSSSHQVDVRSVQRLVVKLREQHVMIDTDLATLYGVTVKALNQAVLRNRERFPSDFMFRLTASEAKSLRSQIVTAKRGRGGRRTAPYAFTEQGVAMLSSVLRSPRAVRVNIGIMRAFVRLRGRLMAHAELAQRIDELEQTYDGRFQVVIQAIRDLMKTRSLARTIGFRPPQNRGSSAVGP
jgi:ORF6N domain